MDAMSTSRAMVRETMICEQMPKAELRVVSGMRFEEFF